MKYKDPITGEYKTIHMKTGDTLPVGTIVSFDGDEIPEGYEEVIGEEARVVISPTEPTTGEEVWIQKSKNLFDINTMVEFIGHYMVWDKGTHITPAENYNGIKFYVKPNTQYSFSTDGSSWTSLSYFDKNFAYISGEAFINETTFVTPDNCYCVTLAVQNNYTWIQVEEGETATSYEPYTDKKIYTKNDDGTYEEFYDGTPKRKKVWENSNPTANFGYTPAIYLDADYLNYDYLEFWCYTGTDNKNLVHSKTKIKKGTTVISFYGYGGLILGREFSYREDSGYSISDCYVYGPNNLTPPNSANNSLIPAFIMAVKD